MIWFLGQIDFWAAKALDALEHHSSLIALLVGTFIFIVFRAEKLDKKANAARLILQEIRYAESRINNFRTHHNYTFTERLPPTNSWNQNIALFVKDLTESELDLVSKFYSNASYLDGIVATLSDAFNKKITATTVPGRTPPSGASVIDTSALSEMERRLVESVSDVIDYVYNTPATKKLFEIAERKWYRLF